MSLNRDRISREMAARGRYRRLYEHLSSLNVSDWDTSFAEIESIIGFDLPPSARLHRPWWGNQGNANGHTQSLAWSVAGWETANVDMEAETLLFRRKARTARQFDLDEIWPVHPTLRWPEGGMSLRREDLYEDRI